MSVPRVCMCELYVCPVYVCELYVCPGCVCVSECASQAPVAVTAGGGRELPRTPPASMLSNGEP